LRAVRRLRNDRRVDLGPRWVVVVVKDDLSGCRVEDGAGEAKAVAMIARPDPLVFKVMLIAGAAILFVGLTMLPHEWQQPGFALTKSLSWQVTLLGLAAFWMAVMYIEALLMLAGALASFLVARHARRQAAAGSVDFKTMHLATLIVRGTVIFLAIVLLFL